MYQLSVKECVSFGWESVKARTKLFVIASIIILLASFITNVPQMITSNLQGSVGAFLNMIAVVTGLALSLLISMGRTAFALKAHDALAEVTLGDLWHPHPYWKFAGTSLLVGTITVLGMILFIVPGLIFAIMFGFSLYRVIETGENPIEAMGQSLKITKGNRWNLFVLGLALFGINILGFLFFIVGLAITIPLSSLAIVHAYRSIATHATIIPQNPVAELDPRPETITL